MPSPPRFIDFFFTATVAATLRAQTRWWRVCVGTPLHWLTLHALCAFCTSRWLQRATTQHYRTFTHTPLPHHHLPHTGTRTPMPYTLGSAGMVSFRQLGLGRAAAIAASPHLPPPSLAPFTVVFCTRSPHTPAHAQRAKHDTATLPFCSFKVQFIHAWDRLVQLDWLPPVPASSSSPSNCLTARVPRTTTAASIIARGTTTFRRHHTPLIHHHACRAPHCALQRCLLPAPAAKRHQRRCWWRAVRHACRPCAPRPARLPPCRAWFAILLLPLVRGFMP